MDVRGESDGIKTVAETEARELSSVQAPQYRR
jgi:hypothetical protein